MTTPSSPKIRTVNCPACKAPVVWSPDSPYRPFCSARCRGMDLGAWASNAYRVAGQDEPLSDETEGKN